MRLNFYITAIFLLLITMQSSCTVITCPPLRPGKYAEPNPPECITDPQQVHTVCHLSCPPGYYVESYDITIISVDYYCSTTGTWSEPAAVHDCLDYQAPTLTCPDTILVDNIKEKPVAEVVWNIEASDNSLFDPNNKLTLTSNYESPHNFTIGEHGVKVEAKDSAGQTSYCSFIVHVKDVEPPTCSFCPPDIVLDVQGYEERVSWDRPSCVDNSGEPPAIRSNRLSGDMFSAPGTYEVQYRVSDSSGNVYTGCFFRISLQRKPCPLYPPPENGVLACNKVNADSICVVMCKNPYDFTFNPPLAYICQSPTWILYGVPGTYEDKTPWPNCNITGSQSWIHSIPSIGPFFFDGDANNANVQQTLRKNTITILKSGYMPSFFCADRADCSEANLDLYIGKGA